MTLFLPERPGDAFRAGGLLHGWSPRFIDTNDPVMGPRVAELSRAYQGDGVAPEDLTISVRFGEIAGRLVVVGSSLVPYGKVVMEVDA